MMQIRIMGHAGVMARHPWVQLALVKFLAGAGKGARNRLKDWAKFNAVSWKRGAI